MDPALKSIALKSAAARYGQKNYRRILAAHALKRVAPALLVGIPVVLVVWALGKGAVVVAQPEHRMTGALIVGALLVGGALLALLVKRLRSPYRRRRFRP